MKINRDSNYRRKYRLRELDKKLNKMRDAITGRNTALDKLLLREDGSLDESKTDSMINDMITGLKGYLKLEGREKITEKEETAYRAYLYLVLTGPGEATCEYRYGYEFIPSRYFKEIVNVLEDEFLELPSEEELDELLANYQGEFGDFIDGPVYCMMLRLHNFIYSLEHPYVSLEDRKFEKGFFDEYDELRNFSRWEEYLYYIYPAWERYEKRLPDAEKFEKAYFTFKHLVFEIDKDRMKTNIADMVDIYLFEQGISSLSFGDAYGLLDDSLDRKVKHLSHEIERVRVINGVRK